MPVIDPDVRAAITDVLAYAMADARIAARARYTAEVAGHAVDADPHTYNLTMATGRTAAILELVAAVYGADELAAVFGAAARVADRRHQEDVLAMTAHPITTEYRAHLASARATINRAVAGHDAVDLPAAAAYIDRVLAGTCPHDPATWHRAPDAAGRDLVTCHACGVGWYAAG